MIEEDDLQAAVQAGTISEAQAAHLLTLAAERRTGRAATRAGEEPFELFRGFNEVFIVVGLGILGFGWAGLLAMALARFDDFRTFVAVAFVVTAGILVGLAEYFIRRRRMVAPAILLSVGWVGNAVIAFAFLGDALTLLGGFRTEQAALPVALAGVATGLFWWRYRVPFAMALIGALAFAAWMLTLIAASGRGATVRDMFLLSSEGALAWGTLVFGLIVFAIAMRFDMGDPHRITLRSANGFWLHVIAAPAIVNTVALTLIVAERLTVLLVLLVVIAAIAIVIDRRSFLLSAAGYVIFLIGQIGDGGGVMVAIFALGLGLVLLGAAWQAIRHRLMGVLPDAVRHGLPPSA